MPHPPAFSSTGTLTLVSKCPTHLERASQTGSSRPWSLLMLSGCAASASAALSVALADGVTCCSAMVQISRGPSCACQPRTDTKAQTPNTDMNERNPRKLADHPSLNAQAKICVLIQGPCCAETAQTLPENSKSFIHSMLEMHVAASSMRVIKKCRGISLAGFQQNLHVAGQAVVASSSGLSAVSTPGLRP